MALACECSDIYVTFNHGVRREKNKKAQLEIEILVGMVENLAYLVATAAGSPINKKAMRGNNLKTKAYP